ncbi:MAG: hypothetical protein HYV63_16500 [Candidatus Schekmanbacteria bacterium]|nr:hypothetical protein [Candidatus Schekmanbacteria bacterium]
MIHEAEEILDRLPELLRASPELRFRLYEVLAEEFPSRREMERLLAELAEQRQESAQRYEATERRFAAIDQRFEALLAELAAQREEAGRRFEIIDARFEAIDRRFEALQTEMDRRFEALQAEMDRRFEAMDKRFEKMDERFEKMDKRFEKMDERFEAMDRRFLAIDQRLKDMGQYLVVTVGGSQSRLGHELEDLVAGTLRVALDRTDLKAENLLLRQKVEDRDGFIGPAGRRYEYDVFVSNGRYCVFEVKFGPDEEDVDRFRDKCDLVERELGRGPVERILVTIAKTPELQSYCAAHGVLLV